MYARQSMAKNRQNGITMASQIVHSNLNQFNTFEDAVVLSKDINLEWDGYVESYEMHFTSVADVVANNIPGFIGEIGVRMGFGIFAMMCAGGPSRQSSSMETFWKEITEIYPTAYEIIGGTGIGIVKNTVRSEV